MTDDKPAKCLQESTFLVSFTSSLQCPAQLLSIIYFGPRVDTFPLFLDFVLYVNLLP